MYYFGLTTPGSTLRILIDGTPWDASLLHPGAYIQVEVDIPNLFDLAVALSKRPLSLTETADTDETSALQISTSSTTPQRKLQVLLNHHLQNGAEATTTQVATGISTATASSSAEVRFRISATTYRRLRCGELLRCDEEKHGNMSHCHIFTDGSFGKDALTMTWSFIVVSTDDANYMTAEHKFYEGFFGGYGTTEWLEPHWHGAEHASAYIAELEALFHAHWWSICHDTGGHLHFHFDSMSAGFGSSGQWGFQDGNRLCTATRALAQSLAHCNGVTATYNHVAAHKGNPWNELADFVAQKLREQKIPAGEQPGFEWHALLVGQVSKPIENLPLAFLLVRGHQSFPPANGLEILLTHEDQHRADRDALWPLGLHTDEHTTQYSGTVTQVRLKCCTLNVRTLYDKTASQPGGAAEYLRQQFSSSGYHICALQETRAKESQVIESADFIRLISAGRDGREGCELWITKDLPMFKNEKCTIQSLTVLHTSESLLVARLRLGGEFLVVLSAQAKQLKRDGLGGTSSIKFSLGQRNMAEYCCSVTSTAKLVNASHDTLVNA